MRSRRDEILRIEHWRRFRNGMDAHPALAHLEDRALEAAQFMHAAWFGPRDDREDPARVTGLAAEQRERARRTCYLIGAAAIATTTRERVRLHHVRYGEYHGLCREERFWQQPTVLERDGEALGGYGYSGLLIGPREILTCWHGWEHYSYRPQVAIFNYVLAEGHGAPSIDVRDVVGVETYPLREPLRGAAARDDCSTDWVILRLERAVTHLGALSPLPLADATHASLEGRAVYALGHPSGLPLKLVHRARVLSATRGALRTDLDTFAGNSGSPVFDAETHALVGLVSEGEKGRGDFEAAPARGCYVTNRIDRHVLGQLCVPVECFASEVQNGSR